MIIKSLLVLVLLAGTAHAAGQICGTRGGQICGQGEYCKFPRRAMCGTLDHGGKCVVRPRMCTREYMPVCGCDGNTYSTACTAASAGVSILHKGKC